MLASAIFARFGRQNRLFKRNATEREKGRDCVAAEIGFELVVAFRRTIALYWPTKCVFRRQTESQTGESGRLRSAGSSVRNQRLGLFSATRRLFGRATP